MMTRVPIKRNPEPIGAQVEAITNLEQNMIISAGAGSGKTWVLTERYLEILSRGYSPSEIVAITFTRKAAGEMKGRIRQALQKMAARAIDEEEKKYWEQCERELGQSVITTIDGFCVELLRSHPLEANLSPQFRVLDAVEADLTQYDIYTQTTRELLDKETVSDEMILLREELGSVRTIVSCALEMSRELKTRHKTPEDLRRETLATLERRRQTFQAGADGWIQGIDDCVAQLREEIEKANPKRAYMTDMEDWFRRYEAIREPLKNCAGWADDELREALLDLHVKRWRSPGRGKVAEYTRALRERLQQLFEWIVPTRYRNVAEALTAIVEEAEKRYAAMKAREQAADFQDVEIFAAELLDRHPEICEKWQRRVSFLMIDEYQDTNELQKSIFDRLSDNGRKMRLFVVGDGKQSIYRFRGADIEVFYETQREIAKQGGVQLSLSRNFRSQRGVIEYINDLFKQAMSREEGDPAYVTQYEPLEAHRAPDKREPDAELIICARGEETSDGEGEPTGVRKQADAVARRVKQMVEGKEKLVWRRQGDDADERPTPVAYGDIAILLATRTNMHLYENAFQEYGIPYTVVGGRQYYEKQEVLDVLNALRMLLNEDDEVSLLAFLRSPFARLSDETLFWLAKDRSLKRGFEQLTEKPEPIAQDQWENALRARDRINRWRRQKGWLTASELLRTIIDETGYRMMLVADPQGDQKVANVDKFLLLAEQLVDEKGFLLYDVVQYFQRMLEEEIKEEEASIESDRGDAVALMSAHASKGLEFPVVFIPELEKDQLKKGGPPKKFLYHPDMGAGIRLKGASDGPGHGLIETMRREEEEREKQEAIRLFYVAMTRAKDYLALVATEWNERNKPRYSWLGLLVEHLLGWESLDERKEATEPIQSNDWKMIVRSEEDIPHFPKQSEGRSRLDDWAEDPSSFSNRDLPSFPLMETEERTYRWLSSKSRLPRLSASALMQYERCPRKFYLQYIMGIYGLDECVAATTAASSVAVQSELSALERGTIVHKLIENEATDDGGPIDEEERVRQAIVGLLERTKDLSQATREILPYLDGYRAFAARQKGLPYETEKRLTVVWNGHPIDGQLDRVAYHPDGEISIFDFKTNRLKGSVEKEAEPYLLQGYLYVELAERALRRNVKAMTFVFLEQDKQFDLPLDNASRELYRAKIARFIEELREKSDLSDYPPCSRNDCPCRWFE